jgi:hypothetical protein
MTFGIMTAPMQVGYPDLLRVRRRRTRSAEIAHAWLFDHLLPIGGDPDGPIHEGWTLLAPLRTTPRASPAGSPTS